MEFKNKNSKTVQFICLDFCISKGDVEGLIIQERTREITLNHFLYILESIMKSFMNFESSSLRISRRNILVIFYCSQYLKFINPPQVNFMASQAHESIII